MCLKCHKISEPLITKWQTGLILLLIIQTVRKSVSLKYTMVGVGNSGGEGLWSAQGQSVRHFQLTLNLMYEPMEGSGVGGNSALFSLNVIY